MLVLVSFLKWQLIGHKEKFLHWDCGQAVEQAARGGGGVPIP